MASAFAIGYMLLSDKELEPPFAAALPNGRQRRGR